MVKNVTMSDIAKALGVSTVTVSKALSDKEGVSEKVREQVKQQANKMGYRYNSMAKSIRDGISGNVGVLVSERYFSDNAFYSNIYKRNVQDLAAQGYSCILEIVSAENQINGVLPNMITNNKIDGLIILGHLRSPYIHKIEELGLPFIFQDFYDTRYEVDSVVSDNVYGSYLLTNYLVKKGIREIAFVGDIHATSSIIDRYLGYYKSLLENDIEVRHDWIIKDRDEKTTYQEIELPKEMPQAFVCNCDETAYKLVLQLKAAGYRVPQDISVVGFDDFIYATFSDPKLTTYRVGIESMSETVVDAIVKKIKDPIYRIGRKVVGGDIVIRDSVR